MRRQIEVGILETRVFLDATKMTKFVNKPKVDGSDEVILLLPKFK